MNLCLKNKRTNAMKIFLLLALLALILNFSNIKSSRFQKIKSNPENQIKQSNINIFDLNKPLEPKEIYEPIKCRNSSKVYVETVLCVHDLQKDVFVSNDIWNKGVWEIWILQPFLQYVNKYPDSLVIDIGGQVGQYSLFAAKMGRKVVTVEPFYDNIIRIHKAATKAKVQDKITLVTNALSDKRNEIKRLNPVRNNIGGQSLLNEKNKKFSKNPSDKYLVETIHLDDLVEVIPRRPDGSDYTDAILKMDIEGFEPFAFVHSKRLFEKLNINIIFME